MPRLVLVCYAALRDDLVAFNAAGGELVLVAAGAVDLLLPGDEALRADWVLAHDAAETLLVPLPGLVFHLLGTSTEHLSTSVAAARKLGIIAVATVDLVQFRSELLIHQRDAALRAEEARLMPMLVLVRQILGVDADGLIAFLTAVSEDTLVAFDAVRVLISEHVTLTRERLIALPAAEVTAVPVLVHRLGVLATENELITSMTPRFQAFRIMSYAV